MYVSRREREREREKERERERKKWEYAVICDSDMGGYKRRKGKSGNEMDWKWSSTVCSKSPCYNGILNS